MKMELLSPFSLCCYFHEGQRLQRLMPPFQKGKGRLGENVFKMASSHTTPNSRIYFLRHFLIFSGEKGNELGPVTVADLQVVFSVDIYIQHLSTKGLNSPSCQQSAGLWSMKALTCLRRLLRRNDTKAHVGQQSGGLHLTLCVGILAFLLSFHR